MSTDATISGQQSGLREYVTILRRRWRWLFATILVSVAIAAAVSFLTTPLYKSTAQLTYVRQPDISSALGGTTLGLSGVEVQIAAETYAQLMTTDMMKGKAKTALGHPIPADATIEAAYVPDTSVLTISAVSPDPAEAQAVANAYATAFAEWRHQVIVDQYVQAIEIVGKKLTPYKNDPNAASNPAYVQLVGRQQDLTVLKAATTTGNFTVASPAELPLAPFAPQHVRDLMLGLLIGIVAGIGVVALVEQLDVRVHTVEDVGTLLNLPVLARFPRQSKDEASGDSIAVLSRPSGASAEAFRMLRGNLDFVNVDRAARSIMVTSCAQGEGKTTTVSNLAVTFVRTGARVLVVDCDLRRPRIHRFFDLPNKVGLSTVIAGKTSPEEALKNVAIPLPEGATSADAAAEGSLTVLTSGPLPPNPGEIVASHRLAKLLGEFVTQYDIILADAPPFLVVGDASALARSVDGLIVVARLGITTKAMLREGVDSLSPLPCAKLGVAVTGIPVEGNAYRYRYYHEKSAAAEEAAADDAPAPPPIAQPLTRG